MPAILIPVILLLLSGCSGSKDDSSGRQLLTATTPPVAWAVKAVAGPDWQVLTLLPDGADPETYEPTLAAMKDLADSRALFSFRSPGFENKIHEMVLSGFPDLREIDASTGVKRLTGTHIHRHDRRHDHHREGDSHPRSHVSPGSDHARETDTPDPHIATSPANMQIVVTNVAEAMSRLDPGNADRYTRRADSICARLRILDETLKRSLKSKRDASFVVMHPSLSYFAHAYGLHQIPLGRKGTEESPGEYAGRLEEARSATLVIAETNQDPARARELSGTLGLPMVTVSLNSEEWQEALLRIAGAISGNAGDNEDDN